MPKGHRLSLWEPVNMNGLQRNRGLMMEDLRGSLVGIM